MLSIILGVTQVIITLIMMVLVLLHSGKGGGLSDMFGGMGSVAAGSTVVEKNLDRLTVVAALAFSFNTIALGLLLK